jgi:(p)ppGpp synthase/HD superfamily hydrolase
MNIVEKADAIAEEAHKGVMRKWSSDPYIVHPRRCAEKAKSYGLGDVIVAAMLNHDVLEDAGEQWAERIEKDCGSEVLALVRELTFPTEGKEWEHKSRAEKNKIREPMMRAMSPAAKICKMIDSIDNYGDMVNAPPRLIEKTVHDGWRRYDILHYAHAGLAAELKAAIQNLERQNKR